MRGRVMALWFVALQGSTPIGGPAVGGIIALAGPRIGLGAGALACVAAAALGLAARRRMRRRRVSGRRRSRKPVRLPIYGNARTRNAGRAPGRSVFDGGR